MLSSLVADRPIRNRPQRYNERLQETLVALRYIRVSLKGDDFRVVNSENEYRPDESGIYPSFAALQLYLMEDGSVLSPDAASTLSQKFYVRQPIVPRNEEETNKNVANMLHALLLLSRATGDIGPTQNLSPLVRQPAMVQSLPAVYTTLRIIMLYRLEALAHRTDTLNRKGAVVNNRLLDFVYNQWKRDQGNRNATPPQPLTRNDALNIDRDATLLQKNFVDQLDPNNADYADLTKTAVTTRVNTLVEAVRTNLYKRFRNYTLAYREEARGSQTDRPASSPTSSVQTQPDKADEEEEEEVVVEDAPPIEDVSVPSINAGDGETLPGLPDTEESFSE